MNILIVDDEPDILGELSYLLKETGHTVFEACHGVEALRLLERRKMEVVITDFDMPFLDGLSLLRRLKKQWPHIHVVVMSGDAQLGIEYWKSLGAVHFLEKPFKVSGLLEVIRALESL